MKRKTAFVSDFDGTITGDDFFAYASEAFFDEKSLAPWRRFKRGEISHFEALREMFSQIRVPLGKLNAFMDKIPVDAGFATAAQICREKNIPVYICSAGCDYYINYLIGNVIKKYDVSLVTNHGRYSPESGLTMEMPPADSPYFDPLTGIFQSEVAIPRPFTL